MLRSLAVLLAAASLISAFAAPASARPPVTSDAPECVERLFYTYIREPEPWSPTECLPPQERTADARPLPDTGPLMCVVWSAVRDPTYISCI